MATSSEKMQEILSTDEKKLRDFQSVAPKLEGNRWGFIGKYNNADESTYLVKREMGGYQTTLTRVENDMIVLECLSATLIRLILGDTFAAETVPVRLDSDFFMRHIKTGREVVLVKETISFTSLSNYGLASKILLSGYQRAKKIISNNEEFVALSLVARLLGVSDIKEEHLISYYKDEGNFLRKHTAIIDCAADLDGYNQPLEFLLTDKIKICTISPEDYGIVLKIFNHIIDIESKLIDAVDNYKHIRVSELCKNFVLKTKLREMVSHVKDFIPQLEMKIQSSILNEDLKLDRYTYKGLARLLEKFPERYRLHILLKNLTMFKKEHEDAQENILKLLPETERVNFRQNMSDKENQSLYLITRSDYSFFSLQTNDKTECSQTQICEL